jgi:hypothetical protein
MEIADTQMAAAIKTPKKMFTYSAVSNKAMYQIQSIGSDCDLKN